MKKYAVKFPYKIGTRFCLKGEDGAIFYDQIAKYIVKNDGIYVVLWLCTDTNPRLSVEIPLEEFLKQYKKPIKEEKNFNILKLKPKTKKETI